MFYLILALIGALIFLVVLAMALISLVRPETVRKATKPQRYHSEDL